MIMTRLITILALIPTLCFGQWTQVGNSMNGQVAGDFCGSSTAISADGTIVAMGSPVNANAGSGAGQVRVFGVSNGVWSQIGQDLNGETSGDQTGRDVSLSADGSIVAIGEPFNNDLGYTSGQVRVFKNINNSWVKIGNDLYGDHASAAAGTSVDLSANGNVVAFGAPNTAVNGVPQFIGKVRVFEQNNNNWIQKGGDIDGDGSIIKFGQCVSLSADGNIVAIGQTGDPMVNSPAQIGRVKVYQFVNNQWVQLGNTIFGAVVKDEFGIRVSLSGTGTILAISSPTSNVVLVYQLNNGVWTQVGNTLVGENTGDNFGSSISLSNSGAKLAVGARFNTGSISSGFRRGRAYVYQNQGGNWTLIDNPIIGVENNDKVGSSIAISQDESKIAVGAIGISSSVSNPAGYVRVFGNPNAVLPIKLLHFGGNYQNNAAILNWKIENQINFSHFVVEKSLDGRVFNSLANTKSTNYKDIDLNSASVCYYRLKMVDNDGTFSYSNIISVHIRGKNVVGVFPNPSRGIFILTGVKNIEDETFTIVNSVGQTLPIVIQNNRQFDMSSFPSGIYYLRIASSGQVIKLVTE
jgi:hypothetical protein